MIGFLMQIVGNILCYWVPESPKYLFKKGKVEATVKVLKSIASANGEKPEVVTMQRV